MENNKIDSFGFIQKEEIKISPSKSADKKGNARLEKWRVMLMNLDNYILNNKKKFSQRLAKGVPDCLRHKVWLFLADVEKYKFSENISYQELHAKRSDYENIINLDLDRTFPNNIYFQKDNKLCQTSLKNILKGLALSFPEVGYCQGINYVAGLFLLYMNDENAFWLCYSLFTKYGMGEIYKNVKSIEKNIFIYECLLQKHLPNHLARLKNCNLEPIMFSNSWFITLFTHVLPIQTVLRIFDLYFFEKDVILYKVALAIIKLLEKSIINKTASLTDVMNSFSNLKGEIFQNSDLVIKTANKFHIKKKELEIYEEIYYQKFPKNPQVKITKNDFIFSKLNTDFIEEEIDETKTLNLNAMIIHVNNGTLFKTLSELNKNCQINSVYGMIDHYHFNGKKI